MTRPRPAALGCEDRCVFRRSILRGHLSGETLERLFARPRPNVYAPGNILFYQGNPPLGVYFLCSGQVKLVRSEGSGRHRIIHLISAPDIIGDRALIAGQLYGASAEVTQEARICVVEASRFFEAWDSDPRVGRFFARRLAVRLGEADESGSDLALRTIRERMAKHLVSLQEAADKPGAAFELALSRKDLAELLGSVPEVVSRVLSELEGRGLIAVEGRAIRVLDPSRLRAAARLFGGSCDFYQSPGGVWSSPRKPPPR